MSYSLTNPPTDASHYFMAVDGSVQFFAFGSHDFMPYAFDPSSHRWLRIDKFPEYCSPISDVHGGPAFGNGGMSLRDYFAAHASDDDVSRIINGYWLSDETSEAFQPSVAQARYIHADTMLAERAK